MKNRMLFCITTFDSQKAVAPSQQSLRTIHNDQLEETYTVLSVAVGSEGASTDWRQGRIEDSVLTEMFVRMTPELHLKVMKIGSIYLLFEIVHAMQTLAAPVWRFMADSQVQSISLSADMQYSK